MEDSRIDNADVYRVDFTYKFLAGIDPLRPPTSIVISPKDLDAMANMERQYWEIKAKYYDVLILFKKGKFYELYDQDAAIAHREFGLKLVFDTTNRGKMRLAGVPEQSFSEWARLFVFRGYKVGRVEQLKEDESSPAKTTRAKVMQRELVEVLTPGTLTDPTMVSGYGSVFILALYPLQNNTVDSLAVDLSRRVVYHCPCGIEEGKNVTVREEEVFLMVSALLQQLHPREIIFPRSLLTNSEKAGWDAAFSKRLVEWLEGEGFRVELVDTSDVGVVHEPNVGVKTSSPARQFMTQYFRLLKLQRTESILSEAEPYTFHLPHQHCTKTAPLADRRGCSDSSSILFHERKEDRGLVLDATTVSNLELVNNLRDGSERGSLNQLLNRCCTNGGRRLFRSWILRPSASSRVIAARQEAIRFIIEHRLDEVWGKGEELEVVMLSSSSAVSAACSATPTSPEKEEPACGVKRERPVNSTFEARFGSLIGVDFERNLSRLADLKNDNPQVAFVDPLLQYKKHLQLILSTVEAFEEMVEWSRSIQQATAPPLLLELWKEMDAAAPAVEAIGRCFDRHAAQASGVIIPSRGTSPAYDEASDLLASIEVQLNEELSRLQREHFGGASVNFSDIGHDRFLVEVPVREAPKMSPAGLIERSRTSKSVKYIATVLEPLIGAYKKATTAKSTALLHVLRSVAAHICNYFPVLYSATVSLSYFDCLLNLASLQSRGLATAWPHVENDGTGACVVAEQLTHPFLSRDSVPNTVHLDTAHGRILLLTGPNMAGKSTLMRTVAVNVMIAQMGGPIFGKSMRLVPVTRIFTRIGARDASHKGQSTLYVELSETADILRHADPWSLCLVDELGRGTSTHDGYAIAYAMLSSIKERQPASPLVLFSTHYHALAQEHLSFSKGNTPSLVQLGYMDFALSDAKEAGVPAITFLYRLVPGICTRSYGVEVALLAGIPYPLVNMASVKSNELANWNARQKDLDTIRHFITENNSRAVVEKE